MMRQWQIRIRAQSQPVGGSALPPLLQTVDATNMVEAERIAYRLVQQANTSTPRGGVYGIHWVRPILK